uniref:VWFA domain-containing protein n=1 Tax=Amphimedon queenslandica TaxID=400682 RepID=A0A1X7UZ52_AMPQE
MISGFSTVAAAVVILLCITDQCTAQDTDCSALATDGDCSFYNCLDTKFRCNDKDYPLRRGEPDCQKYISESNCFTKSGQAWITSVRRCLMQSIVNSALYSNANTTCDQLKTFAFESHSNCHTSYGFCTNIFLSNQCQNLVCIGNEVFTDRDYWSKQAIDQIIKTTASCPSQISTFLLDAQSCNLNSPNHALVSAIRDYLDCNSRAFDFVIILDASGSVGYYNFETMKNFVANMLSSFTIEQNGTRVGVIRYASSPSNVIPLGSINTYSQLATAIRGISYTQGGTNTAAALNLLTTAFATARVSEGIPRVAAVFTDGNSNSYSATVQAAQAIHDAGIHVYSFGIGSGISNAELVAIASNGQQDVFTISGFSSNTFQAVLKQLQVSTCSTPTISETGKEIAATLPKGSSRLLQYEFPSMGMTLKVNVTQGNLVVHGSFSVQNPNNLTQDFSVMSNGNDIDHFISPELMRQSTDNGNGGGSRKRRQTSLPTNGTDANVYLSIVGLNDNNTFVLNTTFGDTARSPSDPTESSPTTTASTGTSVLGSMNGVPPGIFALKLAKCHTDKQ